MRARSCPHALSPKSRSAFLAKAVSLALLLTVFAIATPATADVTYYLTPYSGFTPAAVNNYGVVVGTGSPGGWPTAYYWSEAAGRQTIYTGSGYNTWATDVNDHGLVTGHKQWGAGYLGVPGATLYDIAAGEDAPFHDNTMSHAYALTNSADPGVGGTYTYTNYSGSIRYYQASYYMPNGAGGHTITRLSPGHRVLAVNDDGLAVGQIGSGTAEAFYYDGTTFHNLSGLTADTSGEVTDINAYGTIVGTCRNGENRLRAVTWNGDSGPVEIGVLTNTHPTPGSQSSKAFEINRHGDVVGWSELWIAESSYRQQHGFLYKDGQIVDINDLTAAGIPTIQTAYAINDAGQIATERGLLTPHYVADVGFESGVLGAWSQSTATGAVDVTTDPDDAENHVLRLATGSPVAVSQTIDTPDQAFLLAFDYRFQSDVGELSVLLDGVDLFPHLLADDDAWHHREHLVTDADWFGLEDVSLEFRLETGADPATMLLDNITVTPSAIPEPAGLGLLAVGLVTMLLRRRQSR